MQPTMLIVDDHQIYRSALCSLIQSWWSDAFIAEAANGSETLELITQHRWDVIILDYQLPTLSGGELVRRLRARMSACGLPFPPLILMSTQPDVICFVRVLGAVGFLPKPVEADELYAMVAPYVSTSKESFPFDTLPLTDRVVGQAAPQNYRASFQAHDVVSKHSSVTMTVSSALHATNTEQLQAAILELFYQKVARFPPPYAPGIAMDLFNHSYRIGEYLVQLGYLTPGQLARALRISQHEDSRVPLGFTLVKQNLVPSDMVSMVLLQQFRDRLKRDVRTAPRFLGEQLLLQAKLTPAQLGLAVQEQLDSYKYGRWMRLGDVIVRKGWLDSATIRAVVSLG